MTKTTLAPANPDTDDRQVLKPITLPTHLVAEAQNETPDERRPSRPHTSYSQLATYLRCSMQYYYGYVLRLRERPKVSLSIGKGGHQALEWNTKHKLKTGIDRPAPEVVQAASDFMDVYLSEMPPSEYEKDVEPGALKDRQLAATQVYAMRDAPTITPIGAETEYDLDIAKYLPDDIRATHPVRPVNMKIDLLYQDRKTKVQNHTKGVAAGIADYKYVTRKKTQAEINMSPQLTTYGVALHDLTGRWPTELGVIQLHPGSMAKNPKADDGPNAIPLLRQPEHMTPEALERRMARLAYQFAKAERGIEAGIFIPTDDPITCSWCGFRDRCQASLVDDFEAQKIRSQT